MQAFCHPQDPGRVVLIAHQSPMLHDILMAYVRRGELSFDPERRWFEVATASYRSLKEALLSTDAAGPPAPLVVYPTRTNTTFPPPVAEIA